MLLTIPRGARLIQIQEISIACCSVAVENSRPKENFMNKTALALILTSLVCPALAVDTPPAPAAPDDKSLRPCLFDDRYAQFDFWLGEWEVRPVGAAPTSVPASNVITKILEGCVVHENWSALPRSAGQSFNIFDATTGFWRQTWVDKNGRTTHYRGLREGAKMVFYAESPLTPIAGPGADKVTAGRMTFTPISKDCVRQTGEASEDGGLSWSTQWDLVYTRKGLPACLMPSPAG
jgi:hypothetical protein